MLELVGGPTLAERIAQGPIPLEEVLPIARQIADALEYAHEHVRTTQIYCHVLNRGGLGVRSPADRL